jgi:hypothetical protein
MCTCTCTPYNKTIAKAVDNALVRKAGETPLAWPPEFGDGVLRTEYFDYFGYRSD